MKEEKQRKPLVLIMAGGSGTRMWPLSTRKQPKQLLRLYSESSLIRETLDRALSVTSPRKIFIGTNAGLMDAIRKENRWLKKKNFLLEPEGRNTAPIIAWFCALMRERGDADRPVIVLSADHFVAPVETWKKAVEEILPHCSDRLWCMGVPPSRPDTGYGYIETGDLISGNLHTIRGFREKPDAATAKTYHESGGRFLWNSGMFLFSSAIFLSELAELSPEISRLAQELALPRNRSRKKVKKLFSQMPDISVDYAVLEKSSRMGVIRADFAWDDVGSYESLSRISPRDAAGNFNPRQSEITANSSSGNVVLTGSLRHVALLGVENLVIAEKNGILLVAARDKLDKMKTLRDQIPSNLQ